MPAYTKRIIEIHYNDIIYSWNIEYFWSDIIAFVIHSGGRIYGGSLSSNALPRVCVWGSKFGALCVFWWGCFFDVAHIVSSFVHFKWLFINFRNGWGNWASDVILLSLNSPILALKLITKKNQFKGYHMDMLRNIFIVIRVFFKRLINLTPSGWVPKQDKTDVRYGWSC